MDRSTKCHPTAITGWCWVWSKLFWGEFHGISKFGCSKLGTNGFQFQYFLPWVNLAGSTSSLGNQKLHMTVLAKFWGPLLSTNLHACPNGCRRHRHSLFALFSCLITHKSPEICDLLGIQERESERERERLDCKHALAGCKDPIKKENNSVGKFCRAKPCSYG